MAGACSFDRVTWTSGCADHRLLQRCYADGMMCCPCRSILHPGESNESFIGDSLKFIAVMLVSYRHLMWCEPPVLRSSIKLVIHSALYTSDSLLGAAASCPPARAMFLAPNRTPSA